MHSRQLSAVVVILLFSGVVLSAHAQTKNEIGLVIGRTITPRQTLSQSTTIIASPGSPALTRNVEFDSSLALGAEYDRRFTTNRTVAVYGGLDFLASPLDVKLSQPLRGVIPQYAYVFLTPHLKVKFNPDGPLAPWLSFGGGYTRFSEKAPAASTLNRTISFSFGTGSGAFSPGTAAGTSFRPGTNTGALEFGAGLDTRTLVRVLRIPIGFRFEVRDFYTGLPNYNRKLNADLQHNVAFTGGLLVRF